MKTDFTTSAIWSLTLAVCVAGSPATADEILIRGGGHITGQVAPPDGGRVTVVTRFGGRVAIDEREVEATRIEPAEVAEYLRVAPRYPDNVQGQWALAEWCRERKLPDERHRHLERIVELEPNHAAARRALGYSQVGGQWVTQREFMESRGYVVYRGRWRLAQEVQLMEERDRREIAEREWLVQMKRWRPQLLDRERAADVAAQIRAIRDPHAVPALRRYLEQEPFRALKVVYLEGLAGIDAPDAVGTIVYASLNDPDDEVLHVCLDLVEKLQNPGVPDQYVKALRDPNNVRVNRAAMALGRLKATSAVRPLIDALVTRHRVTLPPAGGPGATTSTFSRSADGTPGGSSFSSNNQPRILNVRSHNQQVLNALVELTGVNLGFDQQAWKHWTAESRDPG